MRRVIVIYLFFVLFMVSLPGAQAQDEAEVPADLLELAAFVEQRTRAETGEEGQPSAEILAGLAALRSDNPRQAEQAFEKALAEGATGTAARHGLAGVLFYLGNINKAEQQYNALITNAPRDYLALLRLGTIALLRQDYTKAEEFLLKAVVEADDDRRAMLQLGRVYALRGDAPARAISSLRNAFPAFNEDAELNFELGRLYYQRSAWREAAFFYDRAVKLGRDTPEHRLELAKARYFEGELEESLKLLRRIIKEDKNLAEAHYYLGAVLLADKKFNRAVRSFERADRLGNGFADARFRAAQAMYHLGLFREAMESILEFRVAMLENNQPQASSMAESMQLMLEIEKVLEVERFPEQMPGSTRDMIQISAGSITTGDGTAIPVSGFAIERHEVSKKQYQVFIRATGWRVPKGQGGGDEARYLEWNEDGSFAEGTGEYPVVFVSWRDAIAYAAWAGKRLPTELEWQYAAQGTPGEAYPWGNGKPDDEQARYRSEAGPRVVREGAPSPKGLLNIVGNVAEWCANVHTATLAEAAKSLETDAAKGADRAYRGGHWRSGPEEIRIDTRGGLSPGSRIAFVGFRCAADLPAENPE